MLLLLYVETEDNSNEPPELVEVPSEEHADCKFLSRNIFFLNLSRVQKKKKNVNISNCSTRF